MNLSLQKFLMCQIPIGRKVGLVNSSAYGGLAKGSPKANPSYGETLPPEDEFVRKAKVRP
jgi:hypothetical protein